MLFSRCLGDFISRVRSIHSNSHEDRTWAFYCKTDSRIGRSCRYSGWSNSFDNPLIYQCPYGVLTGAINNIYIYICIILPCVLDIQAQSLDMFIWVLSFYLWLSQLQRYIFIFICSALIVISFVFTRNKKYLGNLKVTGTYLS